MIEKIELKEIQEQLSRLIELRNQYYIKLNSLKTELDDLYTMQTKSMVIVSKFSFWEKWITRRNEYKQYKMQMKMADKVPELIQQKNDEIQNEYNRLQRIPDVQLVDNKIEELNNEILLIQNTDSQDEIIPVFKKDPSLLEENVFIKKAN